MRKVPRGDEMAKKRMKKGSDEEGGGGRLLGPHIHSDVRKN
jgi:hypothetical protein